MSRKPNQTAPNMREASTPSTSEPEREENLLLSDIFFIFFSVKILWGACIVQNCFDIAQT